MSVQVVPIAQVTPTYFNHTFSIRKMEAVLNKQGQIEPLQVRVVAPNKYETFAQDTHGNDIIAAAYNLGWPTVIITVVTRYIS